MIGFTKGPWKVLEIRDSRNNPCGYSVWPDLDRPYADSPRGSQICRTPDGTTEENKANARLIAEAPAMYEALKEAEEKLSLYYHTRTGFANDKKQIESIRAILSRIDGKE